MSNNMAALWKQAARRFRLQWYFAASNVYAMATLAEKNRSRAEKAEHMAALWKRCAKMGYEHKLTFEKGLRIRDDRILELVDGCACEYKKLEAELTALKKDASIVVEHMPIDAPEYAKEAASRIIEATKEEP